MHGSASLTVNRSPQDIGSPEPKNGTDVMSHLDGSAVIVVEDVLVVRRTDFGWHCEIAGEPVFLSTLQIAPGFLMPADGEWGAVNLVATAANDVAVNPRGIRNPP